MDYTSSSLDAYLEQGMVQWQRFDEAGMPVVAHRHIYAEPVEQDEIGLLVTAVERLRGAEDLDVNRPAHLNAAITALQGLITYTYITLDNRDSFINWDAFRPCQLSVITPGSSVRSIVSTLAHHDLGMNFAPTYTHGQVTTITKGCIKNLYRFSTNTQTTSLGTAHEEAAKTARKTIASEFGSV